MDEKGANTLPFFNLPPKLKKTSLKVFPVLFHLSFWIKEKSVANLAKPQHLRTQNAKHLKSVLPPYHRTGDSAGENYKSGVTLGFRSPLFSYNCLACFLYTLVLLFGFESSTRIWETLQVNSNMLWKLCGVYRHGLRNSYISATYLWVPVAFESIKENTGPLSYVMKH